MKRRAATKATNSKVVAAGHTAHGSEFLNTEKVRALRLQRGWSQEVAAARAGLAGRQEWHKVETGVRPDIRISTLLRVARALGVPPGELLR